MSANSTDIEFLAAEAAVRASDPEKTDGMTFRSCYGGNTDHVEVEARCAQFTYRFSVYSAEVRDAHERVIKIVRTVVDRGYFVGSN